MRQVRKFFRILNALRGTRAVTALEYGLIAAVIGGVVISSGTSFGTKLTSAYGTIGTTLTTKASGM